MGDRQVAILILLDASVALGSQWNGVLTQYVVPLLQQILGGSGTQTDVRQLHFSIISYATADYRPSPIVAKRYSIGPQFITRELKDEVWKLGVGRSGSGGKYGMAALEGYAAALEMFDIFCGGLLSAKDPSSDAFTSGSSQMPLCHLIHVSASKPDESRHPSWNQMSYLDNLTWTTLPNELRKRNIYVNIIMLNPVQQLSDLHKSLVSEPGQARFTVQSGHEVYLSPQSSWDVMQRKRTNEAKEHKMNEIKRLRASGPTAPEAASEPRLQLTAGFSQILSSIPPPKVPSSIRILITQMGTAGVSIKSSLNNFKEAIRQQQNKVADLEKQNRQQEASELQNETHLALELGKKIHEHLLTMHRQRMIAQGGTDHGMLNDNPGGFASDSTHGIDAAGVQPRQSSAVPIPSLPSNQMPPVSAESSTQISQASNLNPNLLPTLNDTKLASSAGVKAQLSSNVALQMQKLDNSEGNGGQKMAGLSSSYPPQSTQPADPISRTSNDSQAPNNAASGNSWEGALFLKTSSLKTLEVEVSARSQKNIRPDLWPSKINLTITEHNTFQQSAVKEWAERYNPIICAISPLARNVDAIENARMFRFLSVNLMEKHMYAIGHWKHQAEEMKPMVVLFPRSEGILFAAVFPETGVPDFSVPLKLNNPPLVSQTQPSAVTQAEAHAGSGAPSNVSNGNIATSSASGAGRGGIGPTLPPGIDIAMLATLMSKMTPEERARFVETKRISQQRQMPSTQQASGMAATSVVPSGGLGQVPGWTAAAIGGDATPRLNLHLQSSMLGQGQAQVKQQPTILTDGTSAAPAMTAAAAGIDPMPVPTTGQPFLTGLTQNFQNFPGTGSGTGLVGTNVGVGLGGQQQPHLPFLSQQILQQQLQQQQHRSANMQG